MDADSITGTSLPSIKRSFDQQCLSLDSHKKTSFWSKYQSLIGVCAFLIFTGFSITVAVLTVYFTSEKETNEVCQLTFVRTTQPGINYDSHPHHIAVGYFNGDNYLDIAVANSQTDNIGILIGYGNGNFINQITYSTGFKSRPYSIAIGDFNDDNRLDIAIANFGTNNIGLLLGYGNGTFTNQRITSLGSSKPLSLAIGDINNDNQLDIVVANYGTLTIIVLLGNNNGSFRISNIYDMGYDSMPYSIAIADLNNDNQLDIVAVNYGTNELIILLLNGNKTLISHKYSTDYGSHPCSIALGYFNNDNILDIAVANSGTRNIGIFLGNNNGTFHDMVAYSTGFNSHPQFIIVTHFNNDNRSDLIVANPGDNNVLVLRGNENGDFSIITTHSTGYKSNPCSIAVGDFDNDNESDIAITNSDTNNILILNRYTIYPTTSQVTYSTGTGSGPYSLVVNDFNNDNHLDIIVINSKSNNIGIFIGLGNGTFENQIIVFTEQDSQPYAIATGDFNKDNQIDLAIAMYNLKKINILLGYGNGSFIYNNSYSTGNDSFPTSIVVKDLNNDNNLDIVVTNENVSNIGILFGYDNGTFTSITTYLTGIIFTPTSVAVDDINGDNILDIIVTDFIFNGYIVIFLGYGNGSFWISSLILIKDERPLSLAVGDLNNDSHLDIVYTSPSFSNVGILLGYGNGTFGSINKYFTAHGSWPWCVALGNFNNDTFLDIAIGNGYGYNIDIFLGYGNGSFAIAISFATGYGSLPLSIMFSDFNNDNQMDLIVSNYGKDNIGVFIVRYEADFASETSYMTGSSSHPSSIAIGDFNSDNHSDIVIANSGYDNIQLLLNYSHGVFMSSITYSTGFGSYPQFVTVADFNRDTKLDIAVANNRIGTVNIFLGFDNGTFDSSSVYSTGTDSFPSSIAVGDLNRDNWTDIVVANQGTDNIYVFLGFDYATFTNQVIYISGRARSPVSIAVGDFNNDHQWDIVVVNVDGNNVDLFLGYGNGTFAEQISYSTGEDSHPYSIAIGDFNNDSQLDIVVSNSGQNNIGILLGYGNGSFQTSMTYYTGKSSFPRSVAVGDFNADNILDIVVANRDSNNIGIFIGYGNGTFTDQETYSMPNTSYPVHVVAVDLNNDTFLDITVVNYRQNNIGIFFGYGNGSFKGMISLFTGKNSGPYSTGIGDLNRDKIMDIVVANSDSNNVGIFFGEGEGSFSSQIMYSTNSGSDLRSIIIHDINNDALLDIIFGDYGFGNGNVGIFYGYGDGNFTALKTYSIGLDSDPSSIVICDFNNDGRMDLAISNSNQDSISILLRYKGEPFAAPLIFSTDSHSNSSSVALGDFNSDYHLDIAIANFGTSTIGILLGNGNGTFAKQQTYSTGTNSGPISIAVDDLNNDTYLDIVVANSKTNTILIFCGYGDGTVALLTNYSTGINSIPSSIAVNDLNKDNHLDIVVANSLSDAVLVFFGFGNGSFFEPKFYSLGYNVKPQSVSIGDINNDNLLDIIIANYDADYVEILLQTC